MTSEDARLDALKRAVAAIVAQTGNAFGFYIHRISVPQDLGMRPMEGDSFAAAIDARIPLLRALVRKAWVKDRATRMQELNEVMGFFEVALASANPVRLNRAGGEWLGYLNTLNAGSFSPIAFRQSALPLSHTLSNCRATFDGDVVTLTDAVTGRFKYGALFSMKTYPALTDVTLLDALDLPLDIVLTNSFSPTPNNIMAERIQRIIRQMHASDDAAVSLREQLGQAADDQEAGRIAFGDHHLSIAVYAPDRDTLERAAAQIKRVGQEIMSVIGQFETEIRAERQLDGIKKAKDRSVQFGKRSALTTNQIEELRGKRASGTLIKDLMTEYGLSKATIYRYLSENEA